MRKVGCQWCERQFGSDEALEMHKASKHPNGAPKGELPVGRRPTLTEIDAKCNECGKIAVLVSGDAIYPHRPDLHYKKYYLCECGAYCGVHPNSVVPLGYPCGPATRRARMAAHAAFDPLWRNKIMSRASAYKWLAEAIKVEPKDCHIGMMTAATAWSVVRAIKER